MDGTLTQTNELIFDSFNHVAKKYLAKRLTPKEITGLFGPPEKECMINMLGGAQEIDQVMDYYYDFYQREHNTLASMYPGTIEILKYLKSRSVLIALFTGKGRHSTDITLEQFGITEYFDITMTGDDVDEFKPSGNGIRKIMKNFSLYPEEVLTVGDAVGDFKASRETGVQIASVVWDSYAKEEVIKLQSDFLFENVPDFFNWLKRIYSV